MNDIKKEYFKFGPWLTVIQDEEDITHQFTCLKEVILSSDYAIKIPVDKEWRQVKEGDLLYDMVVTVDSEGVGCHRIIDDVAYSCKVNFGDILYVCVVEHFLSCDIEIATSEERLHFRYMPMPSDISKKFIDMVKIGFSGKQSDSHINQIKLDKGLLQYTDSASMTQNRVKELLTSI